MHCAAGISRVLFISNLVDHLLSCLSDEIGRDEFQAGT